MKPSLLIVCAGPNAEPLRAHLGAGVDVMVLAWHERSRTDVDEDLRDGYRIEIRNPRVHKFGALPETKLAAALLEYGAFAIADDDLVPVGCTWSDVFALHRETGLDVVQPAIHPSSGNHYSHPITLQEPGARWRRTDFVEVQCPILTTRALAELLSINAFAEAGFSAWGLESYWGSKMTCGILDATPVRHTRPVRSSEQHAHLGIDHEAEAEAFRKKHGVTRPLERVLETHQ